MLQSLQAFCAGNPVEAIGRGDEKRHMGLLQNNLPIGSLDAGMGQVYNADNGSGNYDSVCNGDIGAEIRIRPRLVRNDMPNTNPNVLTKDAHLWRLSVLVFVHQLTIMRLFFLLASYDLISVGRQFYLYSWKH